MSVPTKHHYLPEFFIRRWAGEDGRLTEYRRPREVLVSKRRWPSETCFVHDLYANETKSTPLERQALEMLFMQKVDDLAADALAHFERGGGKPTDVRLRDAWSRFLMSLLHRSPERVKYITAKVSEYEAGTLNPEIRDNYDRLRGPDDPPTYAEWRDQTGPLTPDLKVRLLQLLIDSKRIGSTFNAMHWEVHELSNPRYGFLSGDHPIMISNGVGHDRGFVLLALSPARYFLAAHDRRVMEAFTTQRPNGLETALNDACARQSKHVVIARDDAQRTFIDRRFLKLSAPVGPSGFVTWNAPLVEI